MSNRRFEDKKTDSGVSKYRSAGGGHTLPGDTGEPQRTDAKGESLPVKHGTNAEQMSIQQCANMEGCVTVLDSTWDDSDPSLQQRGLGKMTVTLKNGCSAAIRIGLWMPYQGGYTPTYFRVDPGATATRSAQGSRNEWAVQVAQDNCPDFCLKYP